MLIVGNYLKKDHKNYRLLKNLIVFAYFHISKSVAIGNAEIRESA